eukprot:g5848.t1
MNWIKRYKEKHANITIVLLWTSPLEHAELHMTLHTPFSFRQWINDSYNPINEQLYDVRKECLTGWTRIIRNVFLQDTAVIPVYTTLEREDGNFRKKENNHLLEHDDTDTIFFQKMWRRTIEKHSTSKSFSFWRKENETENLFERKIPFQSKFLRTEGALVQKFVGNIYNHLKLSNVEELHHWAFTVRDDDQNQNFQTYKNEKTGREALATIITGNDSSYLVGALVLGFSLRSFESDKEMLLLATPDVPIEVWRPILEFIGWKIKKVKKIEEFWWGKVKDCMFKRDLNHHSIRWGRMMSKLQYWYQTQYDILLHVDADAIITGPVSGLIEFPSKTKVRLPNGQTIIGVTGFEKPRKHSTHPFNAGVIVLKPSTETADALLSMRNSPKPKLFGNEVDCTEQALLNTYFDTKKLTKSGMIKSGEPAVILPTGRIDQTYSWLENDASDRKLPSVIHWISLFCSKPWSNIKEVKKKENCNMEMFEYWKRIFGRVKVVAKKMFAKGELNTKVKDEIFKIVEEIN